MRRILTALAAASILVLTSACGGSGAKSASDDELHELLADTAAAWKKAETFDFAISSDKVPAGIDALKSATGTANRQPAFQGTVQATVMGSSLDTSVIAVGDDVWMQLFGSAYIPLDPKRYGLPNPSEVIDGYTNAIAATEDLHEDDPIRADGKELRVVTGKIPGAAIHEFLPNADADGTFTATYHFNADGILVDSVIEGPFYAGHSVTYTIRVTPQAEPVTISPPPQ